MALHVVCIHNRVSPPMVLMSFYKAYNTNAVRFSSNKDWGELQTKYFELMTLFCQFALRENGEEKHWYKKILELMPEDDSSTERNL